MKGTKACCRTPYVPAGGGRGHTGQVCGARAGCRAGTGEVGVAQAVFGSEAP